MRSRKFVFFVSLSDLLGRAQREASFPFLHSRWKGGRKGAGRRGIV